MSQNNTFAFRLRVERTRAKLTQEQLAKKIDMSRNTINRIEAGELNPTITILEPLTKQFNCSTDYLLGFTDIRERAETVPKSISIRIQNLIDAICVDKTISKETKDEVSTLLNISKKLINEQNISQEPQ